MLVGQLAAGVFHELLERAVGIGEAALEGEGAQAEFSRDLLERGAFAGEGAFEGVLDRVAHFVAGIARRKLGFQLGQSV